MFENNFVNFKDATAIVEFKKTDSLDLALEQSYVTISKIVVDLCQSLNVNLKKISFYNQNSKLNEKVYIFF